MSYQHKTQPFAHQARIFDEARDRAGFALFAEQGTGKTKIAIDTAAHRYLREEITRLLVLAPNGVHRNWIADELPTHCPIPWRGVTYYAQRASTAKHQREIEAVLRAPGLQVLAMTYDALITNAGKVIAKRFLVGGPTMLVADESTEIKNPGAKRTKTAIAAAGYAVVRWAMTGTPVANSPLDVYAQMRFVDPGFWKPYGLDSYAAFTARFAITRPIRTGARVVNVIAGFRDLGRLQEMIAPASARVLKDDVLDLPPKLFTRRYFDLSPTQRKVYTDLRDDYLTELAGAEVTAPIAMTRILRLAQVTSNYLPTMIDGGPETVATAIDAVNPRLTALLDEVDRTDGSGIIWARFRRDIDQICDALGNKAVRYDGAVNDADRADAIARFRDGARPGGGPVRWFVANPAAISMGVTLTEAKTVIYYNNSFSLTDRLQSEDRAHRIGQDRSVRYVDIVATDTVDEKVITALRSKQDVASVVMADGPKAWL